MPTTGTTTDNRFSTKLKRLLPWQAASRILTPGAFLTTRLAIYGMTIAILIPMLYLISVSFVDPTGSREMTLFFIPKEPTLKNFAEALEYAAYTLHIPVPRMYMNSIIYTGAAILLSLILSTTAAFGFANYEFRAKETLFLLILVTMMIPLQALIIPLFLMLKRMDLLDTYFSLILPYGTIGIPFATLLLRGFFEELPKELRDAAYIDGASDIGYFRRIVLPLSLPALATVIIFLFLYYWNEFLLALVLIQKEELTPLTLGISAMTRARAPAPISMYAAVLLLSTFPILIVFIVFQRWFVRGIAAGALKG